MTFDIITRKHKIVVYISSFNMYPARNNQAYTDENSFHLIIKKEVYLQICICKIENGWID